MTWEDHSSFKDHITRGTETIWMAKWLTDFMSQRKKNVFKNYTKTVETKRLNDKDLNMARAS